MKWGMLAMSLKESYFNKGILKNNLKRFSWIGIVYTLTLLFSVPLQVLMKYSNIEHFDPKNYNPIKDIFIFKLEIHGFIILTVPVITAIFLFRYLQVKKSVDLFHSLPIKRDNLFKNHLFSGILLLTIPVIITAAAAWVLNFTLNLGDFYSLQDIFSWAGITILLTIFIFLFSVFVGIVTGISVVQGILTYILLFLPSGLSVLILENLDNLIYGFSKDFYMINKIEVLSPIIRVFQLWNGKSLMSIPEIAVYIILSLIFYFLAVFAYKKRKSEAATNAIVFNKLQPIFKYGVTFCTMLVGGIYFWETQNDVSWGLFGYFLGSITGYLIAEIVINKSLRTFKNIKGYLIYTGIIVLILLGINFDISGYEKKVPSLENIECIYFGNSYYNYSFVVRNSNSNTYFYYKDENIKNIQKFHKQLTADKNINKYKDNNINRTVAYVYKLKDGSLLSREYSIDYEKYHQYFKPIHESLEYKKSYKNILGIKPENADRITIKPRATYTGALITKPEHIKEAVNILQNEVINETYEEMNDKLAEWADIDILLSNDKRINMRWEKTYLEFEKWLEEKGYLEQARIFPENIKYALVEKMSRENINTHMERERTTVEEEFTGKEFKITDKDKLEICLRKYNNAWIKYNGYKIRYYTKDNHVLEGSFNENNAPEFISDYFAKK